MKVTGKKKIVVLRRRKTAQVLNLSCKIGRIIDAGKECLCWFQLIIQSKGDATELNLSLGMVICTLIKLAQNELDLVHPTVKKPKDHEL